jgi:hypothetical protein
MYWYIRIEGRLIGTVIAKERETAERLAIEKFYLSIKDGLITVEPHTNKRK